MVSSLESPPLLEVRNLHKSFVAVKAVNDISFTLRRGDCLAVVGESGSGKSTLARTLLQLLKPDSGEVIYNGKNLVDLTGKELRHQRRNIQMVFQDPYASLHPRKSVAELISEPWEIHPGVVEKSKRAERIQELLKQVNLPGRFADYYPNQMSGGQRQRVAIARALAIEPEVLILDEPVSALDVSVQAQVINVLMTLQERLGLAYIFISHDLALVRLVATHVAVMNKGSVVEYAEKEELFSNPRHEYTRTLLASSPSVAEAS